MSDKTPEVKEKSSGKSKVATVIGIILCIILVPILVVNVTMIIKSYVDPDTVPSVGGISPMIVLSPSMETTIMEGDLIIIQSVDPSEIKENDIISFFTPSKYSGSAKEVTTHRCIGVVTNEDGSIGFNTRGDNNVSEDPWNPVPAESVVGRFVFRIPGFGNVAMWMQSTPGLIVCIAVPIVLLVLYDLLMKRRYDKGKKKDTDALLAELDALRAQAAANAAAQGADASAGAANDTVTSEDKNSQ